MRLAMMHPSDFPRPVMVSFMRSSHPPIREMGRKLALDAYRERLMGPTMSAGV